MFTGHGRGSILVELGHKLAVLRLMLSNVLLNDAIRQLGRLPLQLLRLAERPFVLVVPE